MKKETPNPWITVNCKKKYENPWITVTHRDVINPKGNKGIYGVVEFKNLTVGILPLDEENNTWLVRQYRYAINQYSWEIPAGGVELTENWLTAAKRELKEETGLTAKKWTPLLDMHPSNAITTEFAKIFIAQTLTQGMTFFDDTEDIVLQKLPIKEVIQLIMDGQITDAITIATILKFNVLATQGMLSTPTINAYF